MKIISSFMNDIEICRGKYHAITFESSNLQKQFRQSMFNYFHNKSQQERNYLKIINNNSDLINSKDFYFISFDCNVVNLTEDKDTNNLLRELLFYYLENNPKLLQEYVTLINHINSFFSRIELKQKELLIEFHPKENIIKQLIKSLDILIEYNETEYVPNYLLRNYLIQSLLEMNMQEKDVFLLISFPETDVGWEDFSKVIHLLKMLKVTTMVITSQRDFLTAADLETIFLVNKNGIFYDILNLRKEMSAFNLIDLNDSDKFVKNLAFQDYTKDYTLMNEEMKNFLLSNRI